MEVQHDVAVALTLSTGVQRRSGFNGRGHSCRRAIERPYRCTAFKRFQVQATCQLLSVSLARKITFQNAVALYVR